jgi:hypothetical protein
MIGCLGGGSGSNSSDVLKAQPQLATLGMSSVGIGLLDAIIVHNVAREVGVDRRDHKFEFWHIY